MKYSSQLQAAPQQGPARTEQLILLLQSLATCFPRGSRGLLQHANQATKSKHRQQLTASRGESQWVLMGNKTHPIILLAPEITLTATCKQESTALCELMVGPLPTPLSTHPPFIVTYIVAV